MLNFLRRRARASARSPVIKALLLVIIVVFIFWGVGGITGSQQLQAVATVNDQVISSQQFQQAYENVKRSYRDLYKERFSSELMQTLDLKGRTLDELIDHTLLLDEARQLGLTVEEEELRTAIAALPAFQADGHFRRDLYLRALRFARLTPSEFEEAQHEQVLVEKLRNLLTDSLQATDQEVKDLYWFSNEKVILSFAKLSAPDFFDQVTINDNETAEYYQTHQESFRRPERVKLRYLAYLFDRFASHAQVAEQEIEDYYNLNKEHAFALPARVQVRHILFATSAQASSEEREKIRAQAAEVLKRARDGEDFAMLATTYSDDPATAPEGGDLGFITKGRMVKGFEEAAFRLPAGGISDLVETTLGFHIIKAEAVEQERVQSLEEAKEEIRQRLSKEKAQDLALMQVQADREKVLTGESLETVAQAAGMSVEETPLLARDETIPGLGRQPTLIEAAFALPPQEISEPLRTQAGFYLVSPVERVASTIPDLATTREEVERSLKNEKAEKLARERAQSLLAQLKENQDLASVAEQAGLTVEESGPFTRQGSYIAKMGTLPELKKDAFQLSAEHPIAQQIYTWSGNIYLATLKERQEPQPQEFEKQKETLQQALTQQKKATVMEELLRQLKEKAEIKINQTLLASLS
jgi:peptidyl-prolyl cis-trans isomerase D